MSLSGKTRTTMKRFQMFLLAAVALFGFAACTQDNDTVVGEKATMTIYATFEKGETRLALGENGTTPVWEAGDKIYVNDVLFRAFKGGDNTAFSTMEDVLPTGSYVAVYRGEQSENAISTVQKARANSFPKQTPVVAAGEDIEEGATLSFSNVAALLKFKAMQAGDYTFKAVAGESLAASFTINSDATVTFASEGSSEVTLEGCLAGKTYLVAVAPATLSEGLEVSVGEELLRAGAVGAVLQRNTIYNLGELGTAEYYDWGLVGQHQGWELDKLTPMYATAIENLYVAEDVTFEADGFKFAKQGIVDWDGENTTFGAWTKSEGKEYYDFSAEIGEGWYDVYDNNLGEHANNLGVADWSKSYDVYIYVAETAEWGHHLKYTIVEHGAEVKLPGEEPEQPEQPADPTMPELPAAGTKAEFGIVGSFQGWDVANPIAMYSDGKSWFVAEGVKLYKDDEFKFVKGNAWDTSYGLSESGRTEANKEYVLTTDNGQNITVEKNGLYNISFVANDSVGKLYYECVEEYTNLTVDITINNKANWNPLYIVLKDGDKFITAESGDLVTDSKYAVSGDYIGSSLSYYFVSGDKKSDLANVTITKNGASVVLDENVVKLVLQLDTDNSKQWWGNVAKIHVWNTGTSFDTSWPGNEMVNEGNYTWSIIVPSELVGKTINYLIHNGNGWQSKDSKITISAEGNTVKGSSIGIN